MGIVTLNCSCGLKMKAPGAVPGRVGKCPRCGSLLVVPVEKSEPVAKSDVGAPSTLISRRSGSRAGATASSGSDGFVRPPRIAETHFLGSLSYPLWNASGIGLLVFMPPLLWFSTVTLLTMITTMDNGGIGVFVAIFLIPQLILLLAVGGYLLLFLGQVLITSSLGEVLQPRSPGWDLSEIHGGLGRWFWALMVGGVVGGLPALAYWITCGEIDLFDQIVLVDLLLPGMAYAQMALLSSLIHESPLAANPVTVTRAILRLGWAYFPPCVETAAFVVVVAGCFAGVLRIKEEVTQALACYVFWVLSFYGSMVLLRRLGLFCYRNAVVIDWFPDRSRAAR